MGLIYNEGNDKVTKKNATKMAMQSWWLEVIPQNTCKDRTKLTP